MLTAIFDVLKEMNASLKLIQTAKAPRARNAEVGRDCSAGGVESAARPASGSCTGRLVRVTASRWGAVWIRVVRSPRTYHTPPPPGKVPSAPLLNFGRVYPSACHGALWTPLVLDSLRAQLFKAVEALNDHQAHPVTLSVRTRYHSSVALRVPSNGPWWTSRQGSLPLVPRPRRDLTTAERRHLPSSRVQVPPFGRGQDPFEVEARVAGYPARSTTGHLTELSTQLTSNTLSELKE